MQGFSHTGRARYASRRHHVELVAYERRDGRWDAFAFEPKGVLPSDWESARTDSNHVFVATIDTPESLDAVGEKLDAVLGAEYELVFAFREEKPDDDRRCRRALHLLHKKNCTGYDLRCGSDRIHELWVRRRDLPVIARLM